MESAMNNPGNVNKLKHKLSVIIPPLIGMVFFGTAVFVLHNELKQFHYNQIIGYIGEVRMWKILLALLFSMLSYFALTINESLLFKHFKHPLPYHKTALASFVSTTISHNIGYSIITGGSLRFRFYTVMDVSTMEISSFIGLHGAFFWLGFFLLAGSIFLVEPLKIPANWHLPFSTLLPLAFLFLGLIVIFYILVFKKVSLKFKEWIFSVPTLKLSSELLIVSSLDWLFSGAALYVLLPPSLHLSFAYFLGVYLLAQVTGVSSQVPGGLGVFETVFLVMVGASTNSPAVIGALVVYRFAYYLLPLIFSAILLGIYELLPRIEKIKRKALWAGRFFSGFAPNVFAFTSFLGGTILLFSGATPAVVARMNWLNTIFPLPVIEISHFLGSLVGTGLIFLAFGLQRRLDAAYRMTLILLGAGIIFSLIKGFDYEEATALTLMFVALYPCRKLFYRKSYMTSIWFSPGWIAAITIVLASSIFLVIFAYKHLDYSRDMWWQFTFFDDAPRSMRAAVGALTLASIIGLRRLLRAAPPVSKITDHVEKAKIIELVKTSDETIANIALLDDKSVLFSDDNQAFIMYGVEGRSWVTMGDPVGAEDSKAELLWKFRELVDRHDGWPVFYEIGRHNLHMYVDMGFTISKLGEEARVKLDKFKLDGKSNKWFRYVLRHIESAGFKFEIIPVESVPPLIPKLKTISDDWLSRKNTREKGFSQGYFKEDYLVRFPMALVRKEEEVIAFSNLWTTENKEELSIDLMRYSSEAPEGTMDYLFVNLMLWGKEQNYKWFDLGMAPLSGIENRTFAPLWNKLGAFIYQHGENFYNFRGLRQYKDKFDPVWEPKYLASPGGLALPRILTNISTLISRGFKGVIGK